MFFPECVFGVYGEFFTSLQDIREFFDDQFELLAGEFRAEPDNKSRDLIHDFFLLALTITVFTGGDKSNNQKSLAVLKIRRLRVKNFDRTNIRKRGGNDKKI